MGAQPAPSGRKPRSHSRQVTIGSPGALMHSTRWDFHAGQRGGLIFVSDAGRSRGQTDEDDQGEEEEKLTEQSEGVYGASRSFQLFPGRLLACMMHGVKKSFATGCASAKRG